MEGTHQQRASKQYEKEEVQGICPKRGKDSTLQGNKQTNKQKDSTEEVALSLGGWMDQNEEGFCERQTMGAFPMLTKAKEEIKSLTREMNIKFGSTKLSLSICKCSLPDLSKLQIHMLVLIL